MKKKTILTMILDSVFVVAFNLLFFLNGAYNSGVSVWICYGFLHFSYLLVLLTPVIESKGKTSSISKLTTYSISLSYFLIELIFAVSVYLKILDKPILIASIQIIAAAVYLVALISNLLVNDNIANKQTAHDIQNDFIKMISTKTKLIESITTDASLKNKVNNLYYVIHSSPTKTCAEVAVYERNLQEQLTDLETLVTRDKETAFEKITEIEQTLNKRNFLLKTKS